ncbi:hypothetical protein EJ06DRAFT_283133 [Trichodelitschia bisporula]|uniref:Uncharacterized protein n=1 Tax=Trichodelitschia bisporula TaxID=703511 RepID=A0A6G1I5I4_9PEZI|nr:hypothetical protein EJ06DRAFT_283133 [Trichodelitschia bisporula]
MIELRRRRSKVAKRAGNLTLVDQSRSTLMEHKTSAYVSHGVLINGIARVRPPPPPTRPALIGRENAATATHGTRALRQSRGLAPQPSARLAFGGVKPPQAPAEAPPAPALRHGIDVLEFLTPLAWRGWSEATISGGVRIKGAEERRARVLHPHTVEERDRGVRWSKARELSCGRKDMFELRDTGLGE